MSNPYTAPAVAESLPKEQTFRSPRLVAEVAATVVLLLGISFVLTSDSKPNDQRIGMWLNPFATCVAVYFWRFKFAQLPSRPLRLVMFGLLIALTLPFIYLTGALVADFSRLPISKWLGDPLWIYTVPTASFFLFDFKTGTRRRRVVFISYCVELFVIIPAWTIVCLYWQLYLKWFQLG